MSPPGGSTRFKGLYGQGLRQIFPARLSRVANYSQLIHHVPVGDLGWGMTRGAIAWLTGIFISALGALPALAAEGAYAVDNATVDSPGSCKVESWLSFASNSDFVSAVSSACALEIVRPIDISASYVRTR